MTTSGKEEALECGTISANRKTMRMLSCKDHIALSCGAHRMRGPAFLAPTKIDRRLFSTSSWSTRPCPDQPMAYSPHYFAPTDTARGFRVKNRWRSDQRDGTFCISCTVRPAADGVRENLTSVKGDETLFYRKPLFNSREQLSNFRAGPSMRTTSGTQLLTICGSATSHDEHTSKKKGGSLSRLPRMLLHPDPANPVPG